MARERVGANSLISGFGSMDEQTQIAAISSCMGVLLYEYAVKFDGDLRDVQLTVSKPTVGWLQGAAHVSLYGYKEEEK